MPLTQTLRGIAGKIEQKRSTKAEYLKGELNMWNANNKRHQITDERKYEIDKARIENGLNALFKTKDGSQIKLEVKE